MNHDSRMKKAENELINETEMEGTAEKEARLLEKILLCEDLQS